MGGGRVGGGPVSRGCRRVFQVSLKAVDNWWAKWLAGGREALAAQRVDGAPASTSRRSGRPYWITGPAIWGRPGSCGRAPGSGGGPPCCSRPVRRSCWTGADIRPTGPFLGIESAAEDEKPAPRRSQADKWAMNYGAAKQFYEREGHLRVPRKHIETGVGGGGVSGGSCEDRRCGSFGSGRGAGISAAGPRCCLRSVWSCCLPSVRAGPEGDLSSRPPHRARTVGVASPGRTSECTAGCRVCVPARFRFAGTRLRRSRWVSARPAQAARVPPSTTETVPVT